MEAGEVQPLERAWCCSGFAIIEDARAATPEVLAPEGGVPMLVLPAACDQWERDRAAGWAIVDLFVQRYGWFALVRVIGKWDAIAADLGSSREEAAD